MPTFNFTFSRFIWLLVVPFSILLAALIVFCSPIAACIVTISTVLAVGATVKVMSN